MPSTLKDDVGSLRSACKKGDALAFESRLLHFHGDINLTAGDSYGNTLLHLAVKSSSSECVSLLLKRNANPDVKNVDMDTPLHLAAQLESSECVRLLLDAGARACECNSTGNTPLHYAAEECSTDTLHILIDYIRDNPFYNLEFEINALNDNKRSPLHLAAQSGSLSCVKLLFENKSNLTLVDEIDNTALHYAAMSGSADCVKFLIDNGADLLAVNNAKYTALSYIVDSMPNGEDLLINILNEGICLSKLDNEKEKLKINLSVLCPESRNRIAVANRLYSSHRYKRKLLLHPLLKTLVHLEWKKSSYIIFYRFTMYLLYLLLLTMYISSPTDTIFSAVTRVSVGFLSAHVMLFCFPYLVPGQYSWFRRITKTILTIVPPLLAFVTICIPYNREWCGISFLLSWLSLPFYSSAISFISHQAGMFVYVTKEIFTHSLTLLFVLVGFALTFFVLYYDKDNESFNNFWHTFLYTILVLLQGSDLGDFPIFGGNSTANSTDDGYLTYVTEALSSMRFASIVASVLFVMVVIIALLNMLVALAVRGGDELLDYGKVYHLWSQAQLLYEWNEVKRFLRMKSRSIETYFYLDRNGYITIGDKDVPTTLRHELSVVAKYKDQKRKNKLNISAIETLIEDKLSSFLYEIKDLKDNLMTALRNDTRQEI
ncbi:transient receptor potential channel pyrexia-like isoform X1 [Periplaneta americana]|uniref:transient receptor potential channel pyrexia-like isoform X1 n=1 Tax=Periplaneta americana TaxID=6978 RepID=UPI0037E77E4F